MYDFIVHRRKTPYFHFLRLVHLNGLKAISSSWDSYSASWEQGAKTHPSGSQSQTLTLTVDLWVSLVLTVQKA